MAMGRDTLAAGAEGLAAFAAAQLKVSDTRSFAVGLSRNLCFCPGFPGGMAGRLDFDILFFDRRLSLRVREKPAAAAAPPVGNAARLGAGFSSGRDRRQLMGMRKLRDGSRLGVCRIVQACACFRAFFLLGGCRGAYPFAPVVAEGRDLFSAGTEDFTAAAAVERKAFVARDNAAGF